MADIFFATNRDVKFETSRNGKNFGNRFHEKGPQVFRLGAAEVTLSGNDPFDDDKWSVGRTDLVSENVDKQNRQVKLGSAKLFEDLRRILKKKKNMDVVIYIHGFANDFPNTAKRTAALEQIYNDELARQGGTNGKRVMVLAFSWPSNGKVFGSYNYHSDRDDASLSGVAMARTLMRLVEFLMDLRKRDRKTLVKAQQRGEVPEDKDLEQCNRCIHVVAHSMGNWALRHAVNRFAELNDGRVPRILDHCFLMAADEDADALANEHKLGKLLRLANFVHVYHARDDRALQVSDTTKGNPNRLGSHGPDNLDLLDERVLAVDCRDVSDTDLSHGRHQYYRLRREVISDTVATILGTAQEDRANRAEIRPGRSWRLKDGVTA